MKAEILCVGSELVLGEILNTNSAWLAVRLAEIGVETVHHTTVGDEMPCLVAVLRHATTRADVVLVTGGIGPTPDDITRQAVALVAGVPLVRDAGALEHIAEMFRGWGRTMSESNAIQADFPKASVIVPNPRGTAAGFRVAIGKSEVIVLPGVPSEMRAMWDETVRPYLAARAGSGVVLTRTVNCFGRGEADITDAIKDLMEPGRNPSVGDTAEDAVIKIRMRATAPTIDEALTLIAATRREVRRRLGDVVFGDDGDTLESVVMAELLRRGETISVAESCTGGLVSKRLTDIPGSSGAFIEGVVAYSNETKTKRVGVPKALLEKHGAVSEPVARALAEGIREMAGTTYGLGITGIAGPSGGTPEKPVGLVYIAVAGPRGTEARELRMRGSRDQVRDRATKGLLNVFRLILGCQ